MLDDFLMVSANKQISDSRLSTFLSLCRLLGIPVVVEKNESGTCLVFLGITLDTIKMEARLPQDKLQKCLRLVCSYRQLQKISIKQLESLMGLLNFACKVIRPGRPFLRRLYNLMEGLRRRLPFFKLRLNAGTKEDLRMWELFLQTYNGVTLFLPPITHTQLDRGIQLASDDSSWVLLKSARWVKGHWGPSFQGKKSSLLKGMVLIVGLIHAFGNELSNSRIQLECVDSEVARVLTCQTYKDALVMQVIGKWVLSLLSHNIHVTFLHTKHTHNKLALSLLSVQVLNGLALTSDLDPQTFQVLHQLSRKASELLDTSLAPTSRKVYAKA